MPVALETTSSYDTEMITRLLRERRTIAQPFLSTEHEPDHGKVLAAIDSARWAPNHHLSEPWCFYLLDPGRIERLGGMWAERLERTGAPASKVAAKRKQWGDSRGVVILTCTHAADADATLRRENHAACSSAAQNFMLHLWSEGIGTKWSTGAVWDHEGFWPLLGHDEAPEATEVVGVFFYGVPVGVPKGRRRKGLDQIVVDFRAAGVREDAGS